MDLASSEDARRRTESVLQHPPEADKLNPIAVPPSCPSLMRGRDQNLSARLGGCSAHFHCIFQGACAVVDARQNVAVKVDHQAAEPALGSAG
jgi:hypothetical protein